ncbi:MAG: SIS domain-containing protein [Chloroflexaceae bacterium]|nr:SIS domain-containing protein [Chloroflexaceae bacterium]
MPSLFQTHAEELVQVVQALQSQAAAIDALVQEIAAALYAGHTLYACGNGGSATDAMHLTQELIGRYRSNRPPLPAVCLNSDGGAMTCIANDFGYDQVFARQISALGQAGDVLVCFSTSGQSPNILAAMQAARARNVITVALLGKDGGAARPLADHAIIVPSYTTARIQEVHTLLLHCICEQIEQAYHP